MNAKTSKVLQKSDLWSLLKDLNSELKDKEYLIEVNSESVTQQMFFFIIHILYYFLIFFFLEM